MPIYVVKCDVCGEEKDIFRKVSSLDDPMPDCCGQETHRILCAPMVQSDIQPYKSMVDGTMITSKSQHRAHLKQHGMVEIGNEIKSHMEKPKPKTDRESVRKAISDSIDLLRK
jgi:hypothetical protein